MVGDSDLGEWDGLEELGGCLEGGGEEGDGEEVFHGGIFSMVIREDRKKFAVDIANLTK